MPKVQKMSKAVVTNGNFRVPDLFAESDSDEQSVKKEVAKRRKEGGDGLINAMSIVYYCVVNGFEKMCDVHNKMLKKEFSTITSTLECDENEAILLSIIFCANDSRLSIGNIGEMMSMSYLQVRRYDDIINGLALKDYFMRKGNMLTRNPDAMEAIIKGHKFVLVDRSNADVEEIIEDIRSVFNGDGLDDVSAFSKVSNMAQFERVLRKYKGHPFLKKISDIVEPLNFGGQKYSEALICAFIIQYIYGEYRSVSMNSYLDLIFENFSDRKAIIRYLSGSVDGSHCVFKSEEYNKFIEYYTEDGIAESSEFVLSEEGASFFGITTMVKNRTPMQFNISKYDKIKEKELFYDDNVQEQIDRLSGLLDDKQFKDIQSRLLQSKMRIGFNILLYGVAGTGKTETCLQLSRITHRDIYSVNVSDFKDKFVGESEKRIKSIFRTYDSMVEEYKKTNRPIPIMLLNEADAIIGIRMKGATKAVDKMENSVQNIILQEMENIKGIMIATTNLTENLDSAFERRFIYKVKYEKPSAKVKALIWKSNLPELADDDVKKLSEEFDFSGGEIENVVRKSAIESILYGSEVSYDMIKTLSKNEKLDSNNHTHRVGFC